MNGNSDTEPTTESVLGIVDVPLRRIEVVESLFDGPKDKRALVDDLGVSRSTVDRATRELETSGLIEYMDGDFDMTPFGEFSASEFNHLVETLRLRQQLDSLLQWVPQPEFGFDLASLTDADILLPEPGNPYNMVNRHVRSVREADNTRAVLPLTGLHALKQHTERS